MIALRATSAYPVGGARVSYTASLQALTDVSYAGLVQVSVGHSLTLPLSGPAPVLKPTGFTGPIVHWTGQLVLTRTR
jgi:hypothetical protein